MECSCVGFMVIYIVLGVRLDIIFGICIKFVDVEIGVSKEFIVEDRDFDIEKYQIKLQLIEDGLQIYFDSFEVVEGDLMLNIFLLDVIVVQVFENLQWIIILNDSW